jgi:hypothetical protein
MVPLTVTGVRFVTVRLAGEVIASCGAGAYVKPRGELLVFPAASVACTEIVFDPCTSVIVQVYVELEIMAGTLLQVTPVTPESASFSLPPKVNDDVLRLTSEPFFVESIVTVGGVLSRFTVTDAFATLPAMSTALPDTA